MSWICFQIVKINLWEKSFKLVLIKFSTQSSSLFPHFMLSSKKPSSSLYLVSSLPIFSLPCFAPSAVVGFVLAKPQGLLEGLQSIQSEMKKGSEEALSVSDLEGLIDRLVGARGGRSVHLCEAEIRSVCQMARAVFLQQPVLLELEAPLKVVGDIHGQFDDLLSIFDYGGFPPEQNYLFLGDYVDRGKQSVETMVLLLAYKVKYPENFFLLRGNHESAEINKLYGFYDECKRKFSLRLWKTFTDTFNTMPIAALIEDKILCMHGGISPQLTNLSNIMNINRPTDIPAEGVLCDLLWADPAEVRGWQENSQRGISYLFGSDVLGQFLKNNDLDLICRSHQIVQEGYEFFGKRQLVTIFSAPNYCGQFENWAAVLHVNQELICSFHVIKPELGRGKQGQNKKRPKTPKYVN